MKKCPICGSTNVHKQAKTCSMKCGKELFYINFLKDIEDRNNIKDIGDWIKKAYLEDKKTYRMIYKELGINNRSVKKLLEYFNIPIRRGSEAVKSQWANEERRCNRINRNKFIIENEILKIICFNRSGNVSGEVITDIEFYDSFKNIQFNIESSGYAIAVIENNVRKKMHHFVLEKKKGYVIDHINNDRLDNRKQNLRYVTYKQNAYNRKVGRNNKTGIKGVRKTNNNTYEAGICVDYKNIYLGRFKNIEDAIEARKKADIKYHGEYAKNNYEYR